MVYKTCWDNDPIKCGKNINAIRPVVFVHDRQQGNKLVLLTIHEKQQTVKLATTPSVIPQVRVTFKRYESRLPPQTSVMTVPSARRSFLVDGRPLDEKILRIPCRATTAEITKKVTSIRANTRKLNF